MISTGVSNRRHDYGYRTYGVQRQARGQLVDWMVVALKECGCRLIYVADPSEAPFRLTFETPLGERMAILAYAFLANRKETKNRPGDEYRFQLKYGTKDGADHEIWQDPYGLHTTLLLGIDPQTGFFVGIDPVLHNPTKMFISVEFKDQHVEELRDKGWHAWERPRQNREEPVEVMVGGTAESFLRYIRFEREALGEDQGHRHYLAERQHSLTAYELAVLSPSAVPVPPRDHLHALAEELDLSPEEILNEISEAPRLKMAVRGWVAELHLYRQLEGLPGVSDCKRLELDGKPDIELRYRGGPPILIECKNVARKTVTKEKLCRLDFQRTRTSKNDPCSRYYSPKDFHVVAACLHAVTEAWEYRFCPTGILTPHAACPGKLSSNVRIDGQWSKSASEVLEIVGRGID